MHAPTASAERDLEEAAMTAARAPQPSTPVNFDVPAGACDCHNHIFGPQDKFPLVAKRLYTPPLALPEEMAAMNKGCHFDRRAIVTASIYSIDNSVTLWGMKAF